MLNSMIKYLKSNINHLSWAVVSLIIIFAKAYWVNKSVFSVYGIGLMLTNFGIILMFVSLSLFFKSKLKIIYLTLIDLTITSILYFDVLYFRYFHQLPSIFVFLQTNNVHGLGPSVTDSIKPQDILFYLPTFLYLITGLIKYKLSPRLNYLFVASMIVVSILLTSLQPIKLWYENIPFTKRYSGGVFLARYGVLGTQVLETSLYLKDSKKISLTNKDKDIIQSSLNNSFPLPKKSPNKGLAKDYNLIMIQVESLQNFVINRSVNNQQITPNLNHILSHSFYFPHFYAQTAEGNSSDAEFLTNTSLYPVSEGSTYFRFPQNDYFSLAKLLKQKNYDVAAFHGDEKEFWNRDQIYPNLGYDTFYSIDKFKQNDMIGMGLSDKSFFTQSISIITNQKQPFFDFMITLTSHKPFEIPKEKQELQLPDNMNNSTIGNYVQSIHYSDAAIGEFIDSLRNKGLLTNTMIVLYGDHKGIFQKQKSLVEQFLTHKKISKTEWVRKYTNVPFIIYNPNFNKEVVKKDAGEIDVFPTLAYLMGIPENLYESKVLGHNIFSESPDKVLLLNGDYGKEALIKGNQVIFNVPDKEKQDLHASELIIKSNYFNTQKLDTTLKVSE